jgi:HK97 family phage prohead protease
MQLQGYAALFGAADLAGDVVRAGAFRATLSRRIGPLPMLVEHDRRALAGFWTDVREDARGLFVRGELRHDLPGAARARRQIARGMDGLSIGFITLVAHKSAAGRTLEELDLLEVSIVAQPMQPLARLRQSPAGNRQSELVSIAHAQAPTAV